MKLKFGSKQITPLALAAFALVFGYIGFVHLGFWDHVEGPKPGFFPFIISVLMFVMSLASYFLSLADEKKAVYNKDELMVIAGTLGILILSQLIGLLPACYLFIVLWLRLFEKTGWKQTILVLLVCMAISIGVFQLWLGVYFPMGLLGNLL